MEIQVKDIYRAFDDGSYSPFVLKGVSFNASPGKPVFIEEASGSESTTLLNILAGLDTPTAGQVLIDGQDLFSLNEKKRTAFRKNHIGYVIRENPLFNDLTVYMNLELPLILHEYPRLMRKRIVVSASDRFGITDLLQFHPKDLSAAQVASVAVASALICSPEILLIDNLDRELESNEASGFIRTLVDIFYEYNLTAVITSGHPVSITTQNTYILRDGALIKKETE